jgi:hypothetical protein
VKNTHTQTPTLRTLCRGQINCAQAVRIRNTLHVYFDIQNVGRRAFGRTTALLLMCSALYELAISTLTQANSNHPQSSVDVSNDGVVFTCSHTSIALRIHRPRIKISSHSKCHNALNSLSMALICRCEERPVAAY